MKWCRAALLSICLAGCAQTSNDISSPETKIETETKTEVELPSTPSCLETLNQMNILIQPNTYRRKFLACDVAINDEVLVRHYVKAMVVTGRFNELHSSTLFPTNVDTELASTWTDWIERNL